MINLSKENIDYYLSNFINTTLPQNTKGLFRKHFFIFTLIYWNKLRALNAKYMKNFTNNKIKQKGSLMRYLLLKYYVDNISAFMPTYVVFIGNK